MPGCRQPAIATNPAIATSSRLHHRPPTDRRGMHLPKAMTIRLNPARQRDRDPSHEYQQQHQRSERAEPRRHAHDQRDGDRELAHRQTHPHNPGETLRDAEPNHRPTRPRQIRELRHTGDQENTRQQKPQGQKRRPHKWDASLRPPAANCKPDSRALRRPTRPPAPRLLLRGGHARIIRPARVRAPRTPVPHTQHLQMTGRMRRRGLRLAQTSARTHRQDQPLIRHLNELRTRTRITQQPTLQLQQHDVQQRQQLVIRALRQARSKILVRPSTPWLFHRSDDRRSSYYDRSARPPGGQRGRTDRPPPPK